jgi:hypothetical protein
MVEETSKMLSFQDFCRDTGIKSGHSSGPTARLVKEGLIVPVCPPRRTHRMSIFQRQVDAKGSTAPRCPASPAEVDNMHASSRVHADRMGRFLAVCIRVRHSIMFRPCEAVAAIRSSCVSSLFFPVHQAGLACVIIGMYSATGLNANSLQYSVISHGKEWLRHSHHAVLFFLASS